MAQTKAQLIDGKGDAAFDTNTLFIDSTNNRVGIGTSSPSYRLDVTSQLGCTHSGAIRHLVNIDSDGGKSYWYNGTPANTAYILGDTGGAYFAGNVGIGTTTVGDKLHIDGGNIRLTGSNPQYIQAVGINLNFNTDSQNILFSRGGTTEMARFDSSGRLLVGTSSTVDSASNALLQSSASGGAFLALGNTNTVGAGAATLGQVGFYGYQGAYALSASITANSDATWSSNDYPTRLVFSTTADGASAPTERMRITSAGTARFFGSEGSGIRIIDSAAGSALNTLISGNHSGTSTTAEGTNSFVVRTNGNVLNTNNSYAGISDIKLKENIVDAASQWNDLKALQVRKYNFKEKTGHQTFTQIGLIAQEAELVSPGLVSESPDHDADGNDLGTVTKSVNYSVLYMKAVKALQEAMTRIETLEAANTDLAARLTALEGGTN